jgi:hypothetical protein
MDKIKEYTLAGRRKIKRAAIDMTLVTAVEELDPTYEADSAQCLIFHPDRHEPFRVNESYSEVLVAWKSSNTEFRLADA